MNLKYYIFICWVSLQLITIELTHGQNTNNLLLEENIEKRYDWQLKMLANPATGNIPENIRSKELEFSSKLPKSLSFNKAGQNYWINIGPYNVGGRTRALAVDISNENIIIAAGVSGGIWKSNDGGKSWNRKMTSDQLPSVTCISQNPNKPNIWYAGTGELYGNSASGNAAYYLGNGIYKSIDNGETWQMLSNTSSNTPQIFDKNLDMNLNIIHNPADTSDHVYVASYGNIYKSTNGGKSFLMIRGGSTFSGISSAYTDIACTSKGIIYAVLSSGGPHAGFWRSIDFGKTWTKITPPNFYSEYNRIAIGIAPSDENQVYFVINTKNGGKKTIDFKGRSEFNGLWKYTYYSGDGSGSGGFWDDRSNNLPDQGGHFGNYNTQGGYDLYIRVKPNDTNMVFIGCNNLWRSTDGFKSINNTINVGGYDIKSFLPDYRVYPNHHPDQHNWIFLKSSPNKVICSNDGGIFKTDDCTSDSINWVSLNSGYITTQYYTVAMDHSSNGKIVIGGLQDNGTWWNNNISNTKASWEMPFGGDGSFCYVPDGASDLYVSKQEGKIYHIQVDAFGKPLKYVRIDPLDVNNDDYNFINPFVFDPNNQSRIYLPAGKSIWRNNDVNQIPLKTIYDSVKTNIGWEQLINTVDTLDNISAIAISKQPANVLYYGTENGLLYKIIDANSGQPNVQNITGTNFPSGYINCITVDPQDTSRIFVVFSNYNISSVFYSNNGGNSWEIVSGNLEQNSNGSGNGQSCRWLSILKRNGFTGYFLSTSTGLYTTDSIKGSQTKWVLQGTEEMGNIVCVMTDVRESDGLVILATHGNGLYATNFYADWQFNSISNEPTIQANVFPNPTNSNINVELETTPSTPVYIEIYNMKGIKIWAGTTMKKITEISSESWPKENYILQYKIYNKTYTAKIVLY